MLDIHVTKQQQVTLVVVNGRVNSLNAGELGLSLSSAIEDGGTQIVLDLSQVAYMSSAGLRELVSAFKKVRRIGGNVHCADCLTPRAGSLGDGWVRHRLIFPTQLDAVGSY